MKKILFAIFLCASVLTRLSAQSAVTIKMGGIVNGSYVGINVGSWCVTTPDWPGSISAGASQTGTAAVNWYTTAQLLPDKDYPIWYNTSISTGAPPSGGGGGYISFAAPPGYRVQINQVMTPTYQWNCSYGSGVMTMGQSGNFVLRILSPEANVGDRVGTASPITSGQVRWYLGLGTLKNGNSAGAIAIADVGTETGSTPWSALFTNAALQYLSPSAEVIVEKDASGNIRQILADQAYVDVVTKSSTSFQIDFYAPCSLTGQTYSPTTPYTFSGTPFVSYLVRQGGTATTFQILSTARNVPSGAIARYAVTTLTRTGTAINNFQWVLDDWNDSDSSGNVTAGTQMREEKRVWSGTTTDPVETVTVYTPGSSTIDLTTTNTYHVYSWGMQCVAHSQGSLNPTPAETYSYITAGDKTSSSYGLLQSTVDSNGTWLGFDYCSSQSDPRYYWTVSHTYAPFNNLAKPTTFSTSQGAVATYVMAQDAFWAPTLPVSTTTQVNGTQTGSSGYGYTYSTAPAPDGQKTVTATGTDSTSSSNTLTSHTVAYTVDVTDDFFTSQLRSAVQPDGVQTSYAYQRGTYNAGQFGMAAFTASTSGTGSSVAVIKGSSISTNGTAYSTYNGFPLDTIYLVNGKSTLQVTLRDSLALVRQVQSYVWLSSAWVLTDYTVYTYDTACELTGSSALNGATQSYTYAGGQMQTSTDASGIVTNFTYDHAGRVATETKTGGPTKTSAYDSAGRLLSTTISDGGVDTAIVTSSTYDDAGRIKAETPAGLSPVNYSYSYGPNAAGITNAVFAKTTSYADGGTKIEALQIDGRPLSTSGTAVVESDYSYALDSTYSGFLDTTVRVNGTASARLTTTVTDWLGRVITQTRPGFTGQANYVTTNVYDTAGGTGRLIEVDHTGAAPTKFQYNAMGQVSRSGVDLGGDNLALASNDLVSDTNEYVESYTPSGENAGYWLHQESIVYPSAGSATPLTTSITRRRLTGFPAGTFSEIETTDSYNNVGRATVTVNSATQTTTLTSVVPGAAAAQVEVGVNGLRKQVTGVDGLVTQFTYDKLERMTVVTDSRSNATTTTYVPGTTLIDHVADATGTTVASYTYTLLGQTASVTNALGYVARTSYNTRGQVLNQWGTAALPVSYGYNSFGERTSLTTYRSGGTAFTAATWPATPPSGDTTTFAFDAPSGLLSSTTDAHLKSVSFTYNVAGQVATRTLARAGAITTTYNYDLNTGAGTGTGRLKNTTYSDGTPSVTYGYTRLGGASTVSDATGSRSFNYTNASHPLELSNETLDSSFYAGRVISENYNTDGLLPGRDCGFQMSKGGAAELTQNANFKNNGYFDNLATSSQSGGNAVTFKYSYLSNAPMLQGITINGNSSYGVTYGYETQRNLLTSVQNNWGTGAAGTVTRFDYSYNPLGQRYAAMQSGTAFTDYFSGASYSSVYHFFTYDTFGQLLNRSTYTGTPPSTYTGTPSTSQLPGRIFNYTYDNIGNRTGSGEPGVMDSYQMDPYGLNEYQSRTNNTLRVLGNTTAGATVTVAGVNSVGQVDRSFGADFIPPNASGAATGSLYISAAMPSSGGKNVTKSYFAPPANQSYQYDDDGNMTSDGIWSYGYDAENRIISMTNLLPGGFPNSATQLLFTYDYMGRRVEKKVKNTSTSTITFDHRYIYKGWDLIAETDQLASGNLVRSYVWGLDLSGGFTRSSANGALLEISNYTYSGTTLTGTTNYFTQYDGNGNVSALVRGDGVTVGVYEYSPYGELLRNECFDSSIADNAFKFSTKYTDVETGMVYYGHRFYSPSLGRFINRDPIGTGGGLNLYGFCGNDGINHADVLGNSWLSRLGHFLDDHVFRNLGPLGQLHTHADHWVVKEWNHNPTFRVIVAVVVSVVTYGAASEAMFATGSSMTMAANGTYIVTVTHTGLLAGAVSSGAMSAATASTLAAAAGSAAGAIASDAVRGTSFQVALRDGIIGAITGGISSRLHDVDSFALHTAGHALLGGAAQAAQGGKFWSGFAASGLTSGIGDRWIGHIGGDSNPLLHTLIAAGLGGSISKLTGGSFFYGALNSGAEWAYNKERDNWNKPVLQHVPTWWNPLTWSLDDWSDASIAAQKGAAGYMNQLTFGFSGTGGFDPNDESFQMGQSIGTDVLVAEGTLTVGAGAAAWGSYLFTPTLGSGIGFWSGAAGSATLALNNIGQISSSPFGQFMLSLEGKFGESGITRNLWSVGSIGYAFNAGVSGQSLYYAGTGAGATWLTCEAPTLQLLGATVKKIP